MSESHQARMLALAVSAPVLVATLAVLVFSALELAGHTPSSIGPARNIAEATALGMASEALRMLGAGEDPNRVLPVRREVISSTITQVTALEGAVWSRRGQMIELLDRHGAIVDEHTRRHLTCLAADLPVQEIVDYLSPGRAPDCAHGEAIEIVLERSRKANP